MLDFIVMQMSKVNREKGYSYVQNVQNCYRIFKQGKSSKPSIKPSISNLAEWNRTKYVSAKDMISNSLKVERRQYFFPLKPFKPDIIALFVSSCTARFQMQNWRKWRLPHPFCCCLNHRLFTPYRVINAFLATDRELITLLETPKSLNVYTPKSNI